MADENPLLTEKADIEKRIEGATGTDRELLLRQYSERLEHLKTRIAETATPASEPPPELSPKLPKK